jgi:hypothetical protein
MKKMPFKLKSAIPVHDYHLAVFLIIQTLENKLFSQKCSFTERLCRGGNITSKQITLVSEVHTHKIYDCSI